MAQMDLMAAERQVVFLTEPEPARHRRNAIVTDVARHLVEIDVAALHDRVLHIERAMATFLVEIGRAHV